MDQNLAEYIKRYIDITDEDVKLFQSYLKSETFPKKAYLLEEGNICRSRYFITKGCLRLFYFDKKGNEQIVHFGIENWWITEYDSLINQTPSGLNLQAIEYSEVLTLGQESLEEVYRKLPHMERFFRIIMEKTYIATQRRLEYMFSLSGEELYEKFFTSNPGFTQRIPQYMLASYLGFTPEFLSKVRAKKQ